MYFAHRLFIGFFPCLLLLLSEEKTESANQSHFFQSWKLNLSKHFDLRHNFAYEINYCIVVGQSSFPSSILLVMLNLAEYQLRDFW